MSSRLAVVGDVLLDRDWFGEPTGLCPDSCGPVVRLDGEHHRPGGAALTAIAAARLGADVVLITAIGADEAGALVRSEIGAAGIELVDLGSSGPTPEKIRVRHAGTSVARLDRGCGDARPGLWNVAATAALRRADGVLLSDYGRGMVHHPGLTTCGADMARAATLPTVWDPHRTSRLPAHAVHLATPSESEARLLARADGGADPRAVAAALAASWQCAVAVTRGSDPVVLATGSDVTEVPCRPVDGDPCGAGDWFAAGAAVDLSLGASLHEAVVSGCDAARRWIGGEAERRQRIIATSGCFDVLHAGHVALLRHARSLGDRLVVLLNSDESVRRLKGHGRPVNGQDERRAVLESLADVDEVRVFDELTPCAALEALRPAVFVKGEDYVDVEIPERAVLERWGGSVAFAPLVPGRSTTRVIELASRLTG
jgi:D-beta-D-heptose 7-phosphate kinase / D-beta-D-heptose 1-phosphate adenosyltransferase